MAEVDINFQVASILNTLVFSWVFLVDFIMVIVLAIFSLFYFNQLLGFVLSQTVGWILRMRYGVYLNIQSVQISLLGGRVMFRNVAYIGSSQALHAVHGSLSWRYWIPRRRKSAFVNDESNENDGQMALNLKVSGVEWFIYNREYAYDGLALKEPATAELAREFEKWQQGLTFIERRIMEVLPLHLDICKLGVVLGNDDIETLAILSSSKVDCIVDMAAPSSTADRYMNCIDADFVDFNVEFHDNPDYQVSSINPDKQGNKPKSSGTNWAQRLKHRSKKEPERPWIGLKRYTTGNFEPQDTEIPHLHDTIQQSEKKQNSSLGKTNPERDEDFNNLKTHTASDARSRIPTLPSEYAKVNQLISCDLLKYRFRVDVVGPANPLEKEDTDSNNTKTLKEPIFDTKIEVICGKINYGPYAERQRQAFFRFFFPSNCSTAQPNITSIGGLRVHPHATVEILFIGGVTLVVPAREESKDDAFNNEFIKRFQSSGEEVSRNYGWLEIRAVEGSKVNILIPFIPEETGFYTKCDIMLASPNVRSSVNHDTMLTAKNHHIRTVQHQPLIWNAEQTYTIDQESVDLEWFVLREHVTLITDTLLDFSTGPPIAYALFTPALYLMKWNIEQFTLLLNVNKGNIINEPRSLANNTFLKFIIPTLSADWNVPRDAIKSPTTEIFTQLKVPKIDLQLSAPNWHTLQGFLDSQRMAQVENVNIDLRHYVTTLTMKDRMVDVEFETNASRYVDTQILNVTGSQLAVTAHGFLIEYLMRVRENYFGHAYHFQTTEEFLQKLQKQTQDGVLTPETEVSEFTRSIVDNDMEMHIHVKGGCIILPSALYSCRDSFCLQFVELNADVRFTNYYMDLQLEIAPLTGRLMRHLNPGTVFEEVSRASMKNADLSISQVEIHAHRMFGLPPVEPTYVVRWNLSIGDITADLRFPFLLAIRNAGIVFGHSFNDDENKPVMPPEELNDVTFVTCNIASIDFTIRPELTTFENTRFHLNTGSIKFNNNDLATERYSGRGSIEVAYLRVQAFSESNTKVLETTTAIYITRFAHAAFWKKQKNKQQQHVALHDAIFHRSPFLMDSEFRKSYPYSRQTEPNDIYPCIPLVSVAPPLTRDNVDTIYPYFAAANRRRGSLNSSRTSVASLAGEHESQDFFSSSEEEEELLDSSVKKGRWARAQYGGPTNDIYPFSSELFSAEREKIRSHKENFNLKSTPWHPDAAGLVVAEGNTEILSMVVQVMPVQVELTPDVITLIDSFESKHAIDFEAQLDAFQISIVRGLLRQQGIKETLKCHTIIPSIGIRFSESIGSTHGIHCEVADLKLMTEFTLQRLKALRVEFDSLTFSLRNGDKVLNLSNISAGSIVLSKLVFWLQKTSDEDYTGSLDLSGVDISLASDQTEWAIGYSSLLINAIIAQSQHEKTAVSRQDEAKATFYALTMAGEKLRVEQDSYVLSKPSGAVHSQSHVRSKISWRLIMRLRYLLQRISPVKRSSMEAEIDNRSFDLPQDAKEKLLNIYRKWRSWEQSNDLEETEIFRQIFRDRSFQTFVLGISTKIKIQVESMVARIVYPDTHDHYVGLDMLHIHLNSTQQSEVQSLGLTVRCSKVRARGGLDLLNVAETIIKTLSIIEKTEQNLMSQRNSNSEPKASLKPTSKSAYARAVQVSVSVFLLDLILDFDFEAFHVETQNHQIQFNSSVELMKANDLASIFHNGTLITTNGAFRVFQSQNSSNVKQNEIHDVFDFLVKDVNLGYASRGLGKQSNSWATLNISAVSFISHATADELATLTILFLNTDLKKIRDAASRLKLLLPEDNDAASASTDTKPLVLDEMRYGNHRKSMTSSSSVHIVNAGQFMNINVESIKFKTKLIDDLRFAWLAKSLTVKVRNASVLVSSFSIEKCTLGIHIGNTYGAVANMQLESMLSIVTYDPMQKLLSAYSDLTALRMETMSLVWILEYAKHQQLDDQVSATLKKFHQIVEAFSTSDAVEFNSTPMSPMRTGLSESRSSHLQLKLSHRVKEIGIRLPLDTNFFALIIDGFYCNFENSKSASGGINDLKLEFIGTQKLSREVVRLNFEVNVLKKSHKHLFVVESDYIRFALDPETVGAMFIAGEKLKKHSRDVFNYDSRDSDALSDTESENSCASSSSLFGLSDLENIGVKLLLQYMTVTWYTNLNSNVGVVIGYEKLHLRLVKLVAKIELAGSYVTPVAPVGEKRSIKDRFNTAYLPLLETSVNFKKSTSPEQKPCVILHVSGKSIALTITPSIALWILTLCDSFTQLSQTLSYLNQSQIEHTDTSFATKQSQKKPQRFEIPFNIKASTYFDSSVLRLFDEGARFKDPALELFSPSIHINVECIRNQLLLRIDASRTANTIYPKAISEIKAIMNLVAAGLKERQNNQSPKKSFVTSKLDSEAYMPREINLIDEIEIDFRLHFESQELHLSCLPFGKVGVSMKTEGVDVVFMTPKPDEPEQSYLSIYGLVKHSQLSLQHKYSRDISALAEFSQLSALGMRHKKEPFKLTLNMTGPFLDIQLSKLHDMRSFMDIWTLFDSSPKSRSHSPEPAPDSTKIRLRYSTSSPTDYHNLSQSKTNDKDGSENEVSSLQIGEETRLIDRYKSAVSTVPFAMIVNLNVVNLRAALGMGNSIGDVNIEFDRIWLAFMQTSSIEQVLSAGIKTVTAKFVGRLGGLFKLEGLMANTAIQWKKDRSYPLLHAKLKFNKIGFYFSLDFHPFIVGDSKGFTVVVTTQDKLDVKDDRIHVAISYDSVSLVMTAFFIIHSYDIIALFKRLQSQISNVPVFTTVDFKEPKQSPSSNEKKMVEQAVESRYNLFGTRVLTDIRLGVLLVHVFPTEFVDNVALKISAKRVEIHYDRSHLSSGYETGIDLAVDESVVSLANIKGGGYKKSLIDLDQEGFLAFVSRSSDGGTIFNTPEVSILMDTWEYNNEPHVVYYKFSNEVHGSIDVGWNLGSVNFIKEMLNAHRDSWAERQNVYEANVPHIEIDDSNQNAKVYRDAVATLERQASLKSNQSEPRRPFAEVFSSISGKKTAKQPKDDNDTTKDSNMELGGIKYIPREKHDVLIPQLRDLGDATPPIEWLGVNRDRIPLFLHAFLMKNLAFGADEVEKYYKKFIGQLD